MPEEVKSLDVNRTVFLVLEPKPGKTPHESYSARFSRRGIEHKLKIGDKIQIPYLDAKFFERQMESWDSENPGMLVIKELTDIYRAEFSPKRGRPAKEEEAE